MKILALIPARGGSKGVPRKNIKLLAGKPLIAYTIEKALNLKDQLYRVIVSTDDKEIASVAKNYGAEVPFMRPKELASDASPTLPVIQHAVEFIEKQDGVTLDWVLLLQPTTPFRNTLDIQNALELSQTTQCDSVISVKQVFAEHPILMKRIENNRLQPYCIEEKEGTRRQDYHPAAYMRNGAIYLINRDIVMKNNSLWGENIIPYVMSSDSSVNIDSLLDFNMAATMMQDGLELE
jgi:CMP-N,N'-diacetyllegionaminic acid synthase